MSAILKPRMSVDEFLIWAEGRDGRYEIEAGEIVAMSPERWLHLEAKGEVFASLRSAIRSAGLDCRAMTDGATIRIDDHTAYEPDALVYCGPRLPAYTCECPNPLIVVEVLSPSTAYRDLSVKLSGYFSVSSVQHYLIVDVERRVVIHHRRGEAGLTTMVGGIENVLQFDPPGLTIEVAAMLPADERLPPDTH